MAMPMWFLNITFWSVQVALLALASGFLPRLLQIRQPRVLLAYWRVLLAVSLFLPFLQPWHRAQNIGTATMAPGIGNDISAPNPTVTHWHFPSLEIIAQIVGVLILAGIAARLVVLALGLLKLRQFRRTASPISKFAETVDILEEMRARVNTCAEFRISAELDSPVTFGFATPVILLPERFPSMDGRFQAAIACHELLHVRRHDWAHHFAEEMLRAAFWFHPAIAWLIARIRLAREQVVDLEVVRLTGTRKAYLEALLEFTTSGNFAASMPAPPFLVERQLAERVQLMLKEIHMSRTRLIASLTAIACWLAVAVTLAVWTFPLKASPRAGQNASQSVLTQGVSGGETGGRAASKIVIADLRIDGDVKDLDAARARILKGLEGHEFDSNSRWLLDITEINIRAEFQDRGYLKALLKNPQAQALDPKKHRMLVSVHVDEGEQYRTGDFSIVSDESARSLAIPERELRQQIQLHTGDLYNAGQVRNGLTGIARLYRDHGYVGVTVKPELSIDDKNHIVSTTVLVHEGNQPQLQSLDAGRLASRAQAPAPSQPGTGGVGYPKCLYCPKPPYPKGALTANAQTVILKGIIDTGGHAKNVEVVKSAGTDFDKNAIETVRKWRFAPAMGPDGKPVSVVTSIEVVFRSQPPQTP